MFAEINTSLELSWNTADDAHNTGHTGGHRAGSLGAGERSQAEADTCGIAYGVGQATRDVADVRAGDAGGDGRH